MYKKIKKYFPQLLNTGVLLVYLNSFRRYVNYSSVTSENSSSKLISRIIADYHVIEKGLTMNDARFGFGKERLLQLIGNCEKYINLYGANEEQVRIAVGVILEYKNFHQENNFQLDIDLTSDIERLNDMDRFFETVPQKDLNIDTYYKHQTGEFNDFAQSRLSVRNYSEENIPLKHIENAIDLANCAPSSCNRQTVRAHIYSSRKQIKEILDIQGGNRGFGHLANKLIILTSDLSSWHGVSEMNGPYVDGGIFTMNLLYSLHFNKIASCPLNCNLSPKKEKKLRKICKIPESEVFIVMISCGIVPNQFKVPASKRYSKEKLINIH